MHDGGSVRGLSWSGCIERIAGQFVRAEPRARVRKYVSGDSTSVVYLVSLRRLQHADQAGQVTQLPFEQLNETGSAPQRRYLWV